MKKQLATLTLLLVGLLGGNVVIAQQDPQFTQYMFNPQSINPAYAGSRGVMNVTAQGRYQWVGMEGAPVTHAFSFNTPVITQNIGLGITYINDRIGPENRNLLFADFSFGFRVTKKTRLAFGIKAGINIADVNLTGLQGVDPNDPTFWNNVRGRVLPNFGFGAYYYSEKFFVGLSAPRLIQNSLNSGNNMYEKRHYFLTAGVVFKLSPVVKFKPTMMAKIVEGAPFTGEITTSFLFHEKIWVGAFYRWHDAVGIIAQYNIKDVFRIGYSYDFNITPLSHFNYGSHELTLSYEFKYKKKKFLTPRYF